MCGFYSYHSKDEIKRLNEENMQKEKSSLETAIENGREMIGFFKDKWDDETLKKQLYLQELAEYNLRLWEEI